MLDANQQNLLMGGTWGKGRKREEAEMTPGVVNGEGARITVLSLWVINCKHGVEVKKERRLGKKSGWMREREACPIQF